MMMSLSEQRYSALGLSLASVVIALDNPGAPRWAALVFAVLYVVRWVTLLAVRPRC